MAMEKPPFSHGFLRCYRTQLAMVTGGAGRWVQLAFGGACDRCELGDFK